MDEESLAHTKWNCKYHIVFAPKYRRLVIYGRLKIEIGKILRELCTRKGVEIVEAECCPRSYTHASIDSAETKRVSIHGVPKREEQPNDIR